MDTRKINRRENVVDLLDYVTTHHHSSVTEPPFTSKRVVFHTTIDNYKTSTGNSLFYQKRRIARLSEQKQIKTVYENDLDNCISILKREKKTNTFLHVPN